MQHFQSILIVIGILAIIGVLIHGVLTNKKDEEDTYLPEQYDDLQEDVTEESEEPYVTTVEKNSDAMEFYGTSTEENDEMETFDLGDEKEPISMEKTSSEPAEQEVIINGNEELAEEDKLTSQSTIDTTESKKIEDKANEPAEVETTKIAEKTIEEPTDIFVFNVVARDGSELGGHELLQFFLTSGFRYGHMNIFHRHEHADGTGEVLFSIANMMAPGTFDLDSMEQFHSQGISFFLTAPNDNIDIKNAFELMLRAVVQIADEFNCDVLNEQRGTLTEAQFIEYRSRLLQYT